MKSITSCFLTAGLIALLPAGRAADDKKPIDSEKGTLRLLAGPERGNIEFRREGRGKMEKEVVAFLGVETSPASPTLAAQLDLPRGTGLVVNHIMPKSPAADVLKEHDILLRLDDQILIETRQLAVLIHNHREGDEVTVTYLRGGQKATAKIKLGKTEIVKTSGPFEVAPFFRPAVPATRFEYVTPPPTSSAERAEVDHVLSLIQRAPSGEPVRIQIDPHAGAGFRAVKVHTDDSNMVFTDDDGSLELTTKEGIKSLVAKDAKGEVLFSGPVNSPKERESMPANVRERLEKLEDMHDITFHTDGNFQGAEVKVMRPRGIAFPLTEPRVLVAPRPPGFF